MQQRQSPESAISNRMKEGNRNLSIFDFSRKEDLRSYLYHNKKGGLFQLLFFICYKNAQGHEIGYEQSGSDTIPPSATSCIILKQVSTLPFYVLNQYQLKGWSWDTGMPFLSVRLQYRTDNGKTICGANNQSSLQCQRHSPPGRKRSW